MLLGPSLIGGAWTTPPEVLITLGNAYAPKVAASTARQLQVVGKMAEGAAPALGIAASRESGADESFGAVEQAFNVLQNQKTRSLSVLTDVPVKVPESIPEQKPGLRPVAEWIPATRVDVAPPAPAKAKGGWLQAASYGLKRRLLASVAAIWGLNFSLPVAGDDLAARVIEQAAGKRVFFTDFDNTLGPHDSVLAPDMAEAVVAARRAGHEVVVVTDRPDVQEEGSGVLTIFESLASIPASSRAGMYVSANSGGRLYRYDERGEPGLIHEEPAFAGGELARMREANEAAKARLAEAGAVRVRHSERYNAYSYALMLQVGTPATVVKAVGAVLQEELGKRGIHYTVRPRLAKDPAKPPYVVYSKLDKSVPVARVARLLGAAAKDAVGLGDSMYDPARADLEGWRARTAVWAERLAARLSGRPMPETGDDTDRNMERGLPGMLMLSVGRSADPGMPEAYVLPGNGPAVSKRVLEAMAAKLTDDAVLAAARYVISHKGLPWSRTDYDMVYVLALESLRKRGATGAQIAFYEKLCVEAPVRGGRFNPWAGD